MNTVNSLNRNLDAMLQLQRLLQIYGVPMPARDLLTAIIAEHKSSLKHEEESCAQTL
jgi:hypothetical protein